MTTQPPSQAEPRSTTVAPPSKAPNAELLLAAAARLRKEHEATEDPHSRALLLHEIAVLLERAGDDPGAARDYLSAFNAEPEFREPLESLVALLHRRRSVKNLGKLLEALVRAGATSEESSRALVERASFLLEQQQDADGSRGLLREAVAENPDEAAGWLELEILTGKDGDKAARMEALSERAARAEPSTWRALLMLDLADMEAQGGDREKAAATCRAAAALEGAARFRAYVLLADLARREPDDALFAEALEAQAELVLGAREDGAAGDAEGVPRYVRNAAFVADALLRAAAARRRLGDLPGAASLLDRAAAQLPGELAVTHAQLDVADAAGDGDKSARLSRRLLDAGAKGPEAASLWMRMEQQALSRGDASEAVSALTSAVAADPTSLPARALQIDFLAMSEDPKDGALLAASLESAADQLTDDRAKARMYLQAAWEWAILAKDTDSAKSALSQAGALGTPPGTLSRAARTLSQLAGDTAWYDEATRRAIQSGAPEGEVPGLWLEIARGRVLRGEWDGAAKALESLAGAPHGAWLGRALLAYALGLPRDGGEAPARPAAALDALGAAEPDPPLARALSFVAALRAQRAGDGEGAKARLTELLSGDASDVASASYLAGLLRAEKDAGRAAAVLQATAQATDDRALGAAMSLEAGLLLWGAGEREKSLEPLRAARAQSAEAAAPLLLWAMRGVEPDSAAARRQAIELGLEAGADRGLSALERFGLEISPGGDEDDAREALEALEKESTGELRLAAALARFSWPRVVGERAALEEAIARVEQASGEGASMAAGERARLARDVDENRADFARHAASWASADPSAETALEWLGAAMAVEDAEGEAGAHLLLSQRLEGAARAAELSAASAVSWLSTGGALPNLLPQAEPPAQLLNLELSVAGCDPRRRSGALKGLGSALGDEAAVDALSLAGWSELAAGDAAAALSTFQKVVERRPGDVASWEGVRSASVQIADPAAQAEATAKLGELCADDARAGAFWEQAGLLWIDTVKEPVRGEKALTEAFARDPRRARAFDRLFRRVRERQEDDLLLALAARRLEVAEDTTEIVKLYWEQARVLRKKGDYAAALEALTNVTLLEPDHVGALALSGEVFLKEGKFEEAAESLSRLSTLSEAPAQQRLISGVASVDIYEKRLNNIARGLEVLEGLHKAGLSTLPVRERLATLAARAGAWPAATAMLEELMLEREGAEGRIAAARLSMAIWRDKVSDPKSAKRAVMRLLEEAPSDGEALDLVLATDFAPPMKAHTLGTGKSAMVQALGRGPLEPDQVARLAKIARATDDAPLLQAALGVLVTLGRDEPGIAEELASLDQRTAKVPQIQMDARVLAAIGDPADTGPLVRLFEVMGEVIGEALGPSKEALGVGRKERVDPRSGLPLRNDIAAWAGALGLGEFELYVGGRDPQAVQGVAGEVPSLVVGPGVQSPMNPATRQAIARELFALRRGITVVRTRDEATIGAIAVATCNLMEVRVEAPAFAILGDVQRQIGRALSRKVKKMLPEICQQVAASRPDPQGFARAVQRSLDRMSAIAAGDVSLALADALRSPRAELRRAVTGNDRAERLLRFVLSPQYLELRTRLGMGVRLP